MVDGYRIGDNDIARLVEGLVEGHAEELHEAAGHSLDLAERAEKGHENDAAVFVEEVDLLDEFIGLELVEFRFVGIEELGEFSLSEVEVVEEHGGVDENLFGVLVEAEGLENF